MSRQMGMRKFILVLGFIVLCLSFSAAADEIWSRPIRNLITQEPTHASLPVLF